MDFWSNWFGLFPFSPKSQISVRNQMERTIFRTVRPEYLGPPLKVLQFDRSADDGFNVVHHRVLIHSSANGSPPYRWFPLNSPHVPQNYEIFHMISVILLYYKQILAKFLDPSVWSITCKKPTITCLELAAFCLAFSKVIFDSRERVFSGGNYMVAQCPD